MAQGSRHTAIWQRFICNDVQSTVGFVRDWPCCCPARSLPALAAGMAAASPPTPRARSGRARRPAAGQTATWGSAYKEARKRVTVAFIRAELMEHSLGLVEEPGTRSGQFNAHPRVVYPATPSPMPVSSAWSHPVLHNLRLP